MWRSSADRLELNACRQYWELKTAFVFMRKQHASTQYQGAMRSRLALRVGNHGSRARKKRVRIEVFVDLERSEQLVLILTAIGTVGGMGVSTVHRYEQGFGIGRCIDSGNRIDARCAVGIDHDSISFGLHVTLRCTPAVVIFFVCQVQAQLRSRLGLDQITRRVFYRRHRESYFPAPGCLSHRHCPSARPRSRTNGC